MKRRLVLAGTITAATLTTLVVPVAHYAVWNVTASVPTGLYAIRGTASLQVGERVAVDPPLDSAQPLSLWSLRSLGGRRHLRRRG